MLRNFLLLFLVFGFANPMAFSQSAELDYEVLLWKEDIKDWAKLYRVHSEWEENTYSKETKRWDIPSSEYQEYHYFEKTALDGRIASNLEKRPRGKSKEMQTVFHRTYNYGTDGLLTESVHKYFGEKGLDNTYVMAFDYKEEDGLTKYRKVNTSISTKPSLEYKVLNLKNQSPYSSNDWIMLDEFDPERLLKKGARAIYDPYGKPITIYLENTCSSAYYEYHFNYTRDGELQELVILRETGKIAKRPYKKVIFNERDASPDHAQYDLSGISISPNPSTGIVNVNFSKETDAQIAMTILSMEKEIISRQQITQGSTQAVIDLQRLPAGIYIAEFIVGNQKEYKKIVITK